MNNYDQLRTEVNKALEVARNGKLIGSSLEAKVYLYCSNESLAERLKKMCKPTNDADALNRIFITSQVYCGLVSTIVMTDAQGSIGHGINASISMSLRAPAFPLF